MNRSQKFISHIKRHILERSSQNIPQLPLDLPQTKELFHILRTKDYRPEDKFFLLNQLKHNIVPGVDETSLRKVDYLEEICKKRAHGEIVTPKLYIYSELCKAGIM